MPVTMSPPPFSAQARKGWPGSRLTANLTWRGTDEPDGSGILRKHGLAAQESRACRAHGRLAVRATATEKDAYYAALWQRISQWIRTAYGVFGTVGGEPAFYELK